MYLLGCVKILFFSYFCAETKKKYKLHADMVMNRYVSKAVYLLFLSLVFVGYSSSVSAQVRNQLYLYYIEDYKDIAMEQQQKYKIPASITLAQGLLESGAGKGQLARKSNNHFGIKCHDWKGPAVYHDDDEEGECFRKYRHAEESYEDHSKFLTGRSRYASLFELRITDYKGWARGLQRCGYATDKAYASKLIKIIEDYDLDQYDKMAGKHKTSKKSTVVRNKNLPEDYTPHQVYKANGLIYVIVREGDLLSYIAAEFGFKTVGLADYNEIPVNYQLTEGDIIYLEKKNRKAQKPYQTHVVKGGESMYSISQRYGIRLKNLYKMNDKSSDYVATPGDVLKLR